MYKHFFENVDEEYLKYYLEYFCPINNCLFMCPYMGIYYSNKKMKRYKFNSYFGKPSEKKKKKKSYVELTSKPEILSYVILCHMEQEHT